MTNPTDKVSVKQRSESRAIANRGLTRSAHEANVPLGNLHELVPGRQFHAIGLDIGSADFSKKGVGEDFARIGDAYRRAPTSHVVVRGLESPSMRHGPPGLAQKRAEAVAAALVRQGVPRDAITIQAAPRSDLDPSKVPREQKAAMRGATIELVPPPRRSHDSRAVDDDARLLKRSGAPTWPRLLTPFPDPPKQLMVDDGKKTYRIAGSTISRQDLVTVGQMLETERDTDTWRAAQIFAGSSTVSDISWGDGPGGGNVLLPLRGGGVVDIDWLNALVGHGVVDPADASLVYDAQKIGWTISDGIAKARSEGAAEGKKTALGHLRAFGNPSEAKAIELAGTSDTRRWTYTDILHPDLLKAADAALEDERRLRARKHRKRNSEEE